MIYLDSAATSLLKPRTVALQTCRAIHNLASPGRGAYPAAMDAADAVLCCREKAAALFHVPQIENVVFTSSATHALCTAIFSAVKPGSRVLVSGYEHNSVMRPLCALEADIRIVRTPLFLPDAFLASLREAAAEGADCAVLTMVSNVFGYILPIREAAAICRESGIPLIVDASQAAGHMDVHMDELGADMIAMPGHKGLMGPQGTGLLLCGSEPPRPLLYGGTGSASNRQNMPDYLPDRLEAGTHNVPGIWGLAAGLDYVLRRTPSAIEKKEKVLANRMARGLATIDGITVFSDPTHRWQAGVVSFTVAGVSSDEVAQELGRRGVAVRSGLHCAPEAHRTVGTLKAGTVRASVSDMTTGDDIDRFLHIMQNTASMLNRRTRQSAGI